MAEHRTNVEIEDILSSIRRLVSEEARAPLVRQPPRLVLSAANRVDRPPMPRPAPRAEAGAAPRGRPPAATPPEQPDEPDDALEQRIAELEAMLGLSPAMFEPDEGDPFIAAPAVLRRPRPAAAPTYAAPEPPHTAAPQRAAASPGRAEAPQAPQQPPVQAEEPPRPRRPVVLREQPPEPEPEPVQPVEAQAWQDGLPGLLDPEGSDTDILDETALREMVRDILRQELQGPLGERITHNVRKLVRSEIARALAAREL